MTRRTSSLAAVLGLIALLAPAGEARAAALDWQVCLKTRTGKFISVNSSESSLYARLDKCEGKAVFTIRDLNGGLLTGEDKIYIGSTALKTRWATDGQSGAMHYTLYGLQGRHGEFHCPPRRRQETSHRLRRQGGAQRLHGEMGLRFRRRRTLKSHVGQHRRRRDLHHRLRRRRRPFEGGAG